MFAETVFPRLKSLNVIDAQLTVDELNLWSKFPITTIDTYSLKSCDGNHEDVFLEKVAILKGIKSLTEVEFKNI